MELHHIAKQKEEMTHLFQDDPIIDPFNKTKPTNRSESNKKNYIIVMTGNIGKNYNHNNWPMNCFALVSFGPDQHDSTDSRGLPNDSGGPEYDTTNGSRSKGEIFRCAPRVPNQWVNKTPKGMGG